MKYISFLTFWKKLFIERNISDNEYYWITPSQKILKVPFEDHDAYVREHPEVFGLRGKDLEDVDAYDLALQIGALRLGVLNSAYSQLPSEPSMHAEIVAYDTDTLKISAWALSKFLQNKGVEDVSIFFANPKTLTPRKRVPVEYLKRL